MSGLIEGYSQNIELYKQELKQVKSKLSQLVLLRTLEFIGGITLSYIMYSVNGFFFAGSIVLTLVLFAVLVKKHLKLREKRDFILNLININKNEIKALKGDFSMFNNGEKFIISEHNYSHDLDVFGERSLYQYVNRTILEEGSVKLSNWFNGINLNTDLHKQQSIIKGLTNKVKWRQEYQASGMLYGSSADENKSLKELVFNYKITFQKPIFRVLEIVLPIITTALFFCWGFGIIGFMPYFLYTLVPIGITAIFLKQTNKNYKDLDENTPALKKAQKLVKLIEDESFDDKVANLIHKLKQGEGASKSLMNLIKATENLEARNNPVGGILFNIFLLWDIKCQRKIENEIIKMKPNLDDWLETVSNIDALNSLGNFNFNHPEYTFPKLSEKEILNAQELGHPFLPKEDRVDNSFNTNDLGYFTIITGANMAGKSTFLRSVGVSLIMAKMGLPVCAKAYKFKDVELFTSMRTTDSLQDNESYFYTELKRLKLLVDKLKSREKLFIILDEILKGTNSKDKAQGSEKFIAKLVGLDAAGIIATHDLSLTNLSDKHATVNNLCFEVEFGQDDLIFDYKLKPGVCKNMNASFLMDKMGIT